MAEISPEAKELINGLNEQELLLQINKGVASRFNNEQLAYVKTRYAELQAITDYQHKQKVLDFSKEANTISEKALITSEQSNRLAEQALATSSQSKRFALLAIVISLVALIVEILLPK